MQRDAESRGHAGPGDADRLPPFPDLLEALAAKDRTTQTVRSFSNALRLDPNYADAHNNLGAALACKGNVKAAVFHFREAVRLKPDFAAAHNNLSRTLATRKRATAAIEQTLEAIRQNPESADLYARLGHIYFMIGEYDKAIEQFAHAHPLESPPKRFLSRLATVHAVKGDYGKTVFILKNMLQTAPDCAALCSDISLIYARQRLIEESIHWLAKAFSHGFRDCSRLINDGNFKPIKDAPGVKELLTANGCR